MKQIHEGWITVKKRSYAWKAMYKKGLELQLN